MQKKITHYLMKDILYVKNPEKSNSKNMYNLIANWSKDLHGCFTKKDTQMAKKHVKIVIPYASKELKPSNKILYLSILK